MPKNRIHQGGDGRYSYQSTDAKGKVHTLKSRKDETKAKFRKRCDELDLVCEGDVSNETFDDLFTNWLENYVKTNNSISDYKVSSQLYRDYVFPYVGGLKVHEVTRADVYKILTKAKEGGLTGNTLSLIRGCISRPYNWSINALGYRLTAPTSGLIFKSGESKPKVRIVSKEEEARFFKAAKSSKYYNYFRILLLSGLRPSECLGLKTKEIKSDVLEIRQAFTRHGYSDLKTVNARRDFPLHPELKRYLHLQRLEAIKIGSEWLFTSDTGKPSMQAIESAFRRIVRQTATRKPSMVAKPVEFSMYDFRHTFATRQAENGMPMNILAELMGHEDSSTTMRYYIGLTDKMIDQAVDIMSKMS